MSPEFQLLTIVDKECELRATLAINKMADTKTQSLLFADFELIAGMGARSIVLDLRSLQFFEGTVPGKLLKLSNAVQQAGGSLTVLAASNVCEVLRLLQLDRKFKISDSEEASGLFKLS
jgi:anti-anti-sigma regulatory factor